MSERSIPASPMTSATSGAMSSLATFCSVRDLVYIWAPGPSVLGNARHSRAVLGERGEADDVDMPGAPSGARSTMTAAPASPSVSDASCLLNRERICLAAFQSARFPVNVPESRSARSARDRLSGTRRVLRRTVRKPCTAYVISGMSHPWRIVSASASWWISSWCQATREWCVVIYGCRAAYEPVAGRHLSRGRAAPEPVLAAREGGPVRHASRC